MAALFTPARHSPRHCADCGAARHLHTAAGDCPVAYRPDTLADALRELAAAQAAGDPARIFVARGEAQRLHGRRHTGCATCRLLEG